MGAATAVVIDPSFTRREAKVREGRLDSLWPPLWPPTREFTPLSDDADISANSR